MKGNYEWDLELFMGSRQTIQRRNQVNGRKSLLLFSVLLSSLDSACEKGHWKGAESPPYTVGSLILVKDEIRQEDNIFIY